MNRTELDNLQMITTLTEGRKRTTCLTCSDKKGWFYASVLWKDGEGEPKEYKEFGRNQLAAIQYHLDRVGEDG